MKKISIIAVAILLLSGCYSSSKMARMSDGNLIDITQDAEEYEVSVLDPGFETWFASTWSLSKDRDEAYYAHWNQRYVSEWNFKATRPHTARFFNSQIQYDPTVNYGIEVERKLYYYFRWVDTKLGIPILDARPPGLV